jgi:hypothetical protein
MLIRPPQDYDYCIALSFAGEMRPWAKLLREALVVEARKLPQWEERADQRLVFCESDTDGYSLGEIGGILARQAILVVPLFSSQYGRTEGTRAEWAAIEPLTRHEQPRRVLGVSLPGESHELDPGHIAIDAQTDDLSEIAKKILLQLRWLSDTWKPESLLPKICGTSPDDRRYAVSEKPDDLNDWHDQIFCLSPNPSRWDWTMLERYLDLAQSRLLGMSVFTDAALLQPAGWQQRLSKVPIFSMERLSQAIDVLCRPRGNVFFDEIFHRDALRLRQLVRDQETPFCSWLGVRWWNIDRVDRSSVCSAATTGSVELNIFMLSENAINKARFAYLGELAAVSHDRVRNIFVLDARILPNRAFRPYWENAFPYTYFSDESRAKLMEHLARELLGLVGI